VTITVTQAQAENQLPNANGDNFTVEQDSSSTSFNVLTNDSDPDGDDLLITNITAVHTAASSTSKQ